MRLAVALFLIALPVIARAEVKQTYDKFQDRTTIISEPQPVPTTKPARTKMFAGWHYEFAGKTDAGSPTEVRFFVAFISDEWMFLRNGRQATLILLCDGKKITVDSEVYNNKILDDGKVSERFSFVISIDDAKAMAGSRTCEGQVSPCEFSLAERHRTQLREFLSAIQGRPSDTGRGGQKVKG